MTRKLPVFFHIPKNAGTYITSTSYYAAHELSNGNKYYVDVVKGNITFYRLICFDQGDLNNKYKKINIFHKTILSTQFTKSYSICHSFLFIQPKKCIFNGSIKNL